MIRDFGRRYIYLFIARYVSRDPKGLRGMNSPRLLLFPGVSYLESSELCQPLLTENTVPSTADSTRSCSSIFTPR
jgi:hypothetical protein